MTRKIHIIERGGHTNVILQYLFAAQLASLLGNTIISGTNSHQLPWVMTDGSLSRWVPSIPLQDTPIIGVTEVLKSRRSFHIKYRAVPSQLSNLPDWASSNELIPKVAEPTYLSANDELLINVRGDEILGRCHPDYGPVPLSFIHATIEGTGLKPVFLGQLGDDYYSRGLRAQFPKARFIGSGGAYCDFEAIRSAHHILPAVSTFSWLASWLSCAQSIHLPVLGMLNPEQRNDTWLLPHTEPRYCFYKFPIRIWNGSNEQVKSVLDGPNTSEIVSNAYLDVLKNRNDVSRASARSRKLRRFKNTMYVARLIPQFFGAL